MNVHLSSTIDAEVAQFWATFQDDVMGCLAHWGKFKAPVELISVESFEAVGGRATAPVDGLLYGLAELDSVTILAPRYWPNPPDSDTLRRVIVHELAHVILFQRCAPPGRSHPVALATWFREGMAVLAAEGTPDARILRQLGPAQSWLANATADARRFADFGQQCYHIAHVLFDKWYTQYGPRKLTKLCRQMRHGAGFEEAFEVAAERTHAHFVTETLSTIADRLL